MLSHHSGIFRRWAQSLSRLIRTTRKQIIAPRRCLMVQQALHLHLRYQFAHLFTGLTNQLWGQDPNYRKLTSFSQDFLSSLGCLAILWIKTSLYHFEMKWKKDGIIAFPWLSCSQPVSLKWDILAVFFFDKLLILLRNDSRASHLSACLLVRRLKDSFVVS